MQTVTTKAIAKVAAVATGLAMATSMLSFAPMAYAASLTSSQIQSILSLLSSFGANSATIANVHAALNGTSSTTTTGGTTTTTTSSSCSFSEDSHDRLDRRGGNVPPAGAHRERLFDSGRCDWLLRCPDAGGSSGVAEGSRRFADGRLLRCYLARPLESRRLVF